MLAHGYSPRFATGVVAGSSVLGMLIRGPVEDAVRALLVNARPGELKRRVEGA